MKQNCFNCREEIDTQDILFIPTCDKCKKWKKMLLESYVSMRGNKQK